MPRCVQKSVPSHSEMHAKSTDFRPNGMDSQNGKIHSKSHSEPHAEIHSEWNAKLHSELHSELYSELHSEWNAELTKKKCKKGKKELRIEHRIFCMDIVLNMEISGFERWTSCMLLWYSANL